MVRWAIAVALLSSRPVVIVPGPADSPPPADWVITHNARKALWGDPALSELNLGVRVRNGEALLWGPVLTEQQAGEAVARVRLVSGIRTVVNELYVLPAADLLRQKLPSPKAWAPAKPQRNPSDRRDAGVKSLPSSLTGLADDLRGSERRFEGLQVSWQGNVATVTGRANRDLDVMEFAERLRKLPGVERVILRAETGR